MHCADISIRGDFFMKKSDCTVLVIVLLLSIIATMVLIDSEDSVGDTVDSSKVLDIKDFEEYGEPQIIISETLTKNQPYFSIIVENSNKDQIKLDFIYLRGKIGGTITINSVVLTGTTNGIECLDLSKINDKVNNLSITTSAFGDINIKKLISGNNNIQGLQQNKYIEEVDLSGYTSFDTIKSNAYGYCTNLQKITLPDSNYTIGTTAFTGCTSLESINLKKCTSVEYSAFNGSGLKSIEIGTSLSDGESVRISSDAFAGCPNLKSVTIENATLLSNTFMNCSNLSELTFKGKLIFDSTSRQSFFNTGLVSIAIPDEISIPQLTFSRCSQLVGVTFGDNVEIGNDAFSGCEKLSKLKFGKNNKVGERAFDNCVTLGYSTDEYKFALDGVVSISTNAFRDCTSIESLTIPGSVTSLEFDAFEGCVGIKELKLDSGNDTFILIDGALYTKDKTELIMAIPTITELKLPKETTKIAGFEYSSDGSIVSAGEINALLPLSSLSRISVDSGNSVFKNDSNGCLLLSSGDLIFVPCNISSERELTIENYHVKGYAFNNTNLRSIIFKNSSLEPSSVYNCDLVTTIKVEIKDSDIDTFDLSFYAIVSGRMLSKLEVNSDVSLTVKKTTSSGETQFGDIVIKAKGLTIEPLTFYFSSDKVTPYLENLSLISKGNITIGKTAIHNQSALKELLLVAGNTLTVPSEDGWMTGRFDVISDVYIDSQKFEGKMFESDANLWVSPELESFFDNEKGYVKYDDTYGISLSDGSLKYKDKSVFMQSSISKVEITIDESKNSFTVKTGDSHATNDLIVKVNGSEVSPADHSYAFGEISTGYIIIIIEEKPEDTKWHTVTFDSGSSKSTVYVSDGHSVLSSMIPSFVRNGYELKGWFLDSEFKQNYFESDNREIKKDTVLYALWTSVGNYLDVDDSAGTFYYEKDGKQEKYVRGTYSNGTLVLTFVAKTGYTFYGFDNTSSDSIGINGNTITITKIDGYVCLKPLTKYVSSSTDLEYVVEQKTPKYSDDVILVWSFDGGKVNQSGMVWSGMPSVPLIVDGFVYIQVNDEIYKLDASTGAKIKSITTGHSTTEFYHYLGYGGGYIVDYTSSNVYTEDLELICSMPDGITYLIWHDGYFYGISNGKDEVGIIYKMNPTQTTTTSDSSTMMKNLWTNETKKVNVIQSIFGTTAHAVIEGDVMYYISTEGKKIFINALDLSAGTFTTKDLNIEGYYLDDGWLTYYNGYLYITAYAESLFGEGSSNKTNSMIGYMKVDGVQIEDVSYVYIGGEGSNPKYRSLTSAFVIQNGRGYVNVTAGLAGRTAIKGYFMVYNIGEDGKPEFEKEVASTSSHGSLVASTYYYDDVTKNGDVYIYLLNYSSDQGIRIFKDTCIDGEWTLYSYASISEVEGGFGSQAVRVGTEGQLIFYNDSGKVFCYASTEFASKHGFFIDNGDTAEIKLGDGVNRDPVKAFEQAIANAFGVRSIELNTEDGTVNILGETYYVYYYGSDGIAVPLKYGKTFSEKDFVKIKAFYLSKDVKFAEDLDPDYVWFGVDGSDVEEYVIKDTMANLRTYQPMTLSVKPLVKYSIDDEDYVKRGYHGSFVTIDIGVNEDGKYTQPKEREGYTFLGFSDGEKVYKIGDKYKITSPVTELKPVWINDNVGITKLSISIGNKIVEDKDSISLFTGDVTELKVVIEPDGAGVYEVSSSNTNVLSLDGSKITAIKPGKVNLTITVKSSEGDKEVVIGIEIVDKTSTKVTISGSSSIDLYKGDTKTLSAFTDLDGVGVVWTSSDPKVAVVDSNGKITAISEGVVLITATAADNSDAKAVCTVVVSLKKVSSVTMSQTSKTMKVGDSSALSATVTPSDAENKKVTWSSSNPSVVSVTASGAIQALSKGTAIITATSVDGSFSANCTVTVQGTVSEISLDKAILRLEVGSNSTLKAMTYPDEALSGNIVWKSSDTSIVSVSGGYVVASKVGTATITASYGDLVASCTIVVSEKTVVKEDMKDNTDGSKTVTKEEKTVSGGSTIITNTKETKDKDDKSMGSDVKITAESENKVVKTEATVKKDADGKVIESEVKTTVEAKNQTKDGKEIVSVSKEDILSAVDQIGAVKNTAGGNVEPVIVIDIGKASTASSSSIDLSYESLIQIADGNDTTLRVNTSAGTLEMTADVIATLSSDGLDLKLGIEKVSNVELTTSIKDKVKDSTVFSLSATLGKTDVHQLGGKVSVSLPYALKGANSKDVRIYHVDDNGTLKEMSCKYDQTNGMVSFVTDHFSYFVVSEESLVSESSTNTDGDSELNTLLKIVIGLLAVLIAISIVAMVMILRGH